MPSDAMIDNIKFALALNRAVLGGEHQNGIGTYGEKMLHRTLKFYFEPDESKHEIDHLGSVADILNENGIIEIQTRSFSKLIPKLERFLEKDKVTVVCPIIENKTICRIDQESGETNPPRKSRKKGRVSDTLAEISLIRRFIPHENLNILVVMLDADETRLLKGRLKVGRKRTDKINCIPTSLNQIIDLRTTSDYYQLLPDGLKDEFTAVDFERISGHKGIGAHGALMLLLQLGILSRSRVGKEPYIYKINYTK